MDKMEKKYKQDIAIVGMAGKFPMANNIDEFWNNLILGNDCITRRRTAETDDIIKYAYGAISEPFIFDNEFFKINPKEAKTISPQERILLEVSYKALEDAGCVPNEFKGKIGIVCGAPENDYRNRIMTATQVVDDFTQVQFSDSSLVTRVSYKLNLTGPCIYLLTACATSLTAVHVAAKMLIDKEADAILAGGVNVYPNQDIYGSVEGLLSHDGVVRAFDRNGSGTVPGNGVAMIVLKRLEDALNAGDHIYAVIKGSAIGNDGNRKIGFTAPSLLGEMEVLEGALEVSGVDKTEIDFIETHGTATPLGDAVELSAIKKVYENVELEKPIILGALKSNYGHLNMVAGIAGVIKAALVLKNGVIPPSINIENVNEELRNSDIIKISNEAIPLDKTGRLLHATVSSFGIGGVNANVVLEEFRENNDKCNAQLSLFPISANTETALKNNIDNHKEWIKSNKELIGKASYTLTNCRANLPYRSYMIVSEDGNIKYESPINIVKGKKKNRITFMFPGMGTGYENMGKDIYYKFPIFSKYYEQCRNIIYTFTNGKIDILQNVKEEDMALNIVSVSYSIAKVLEEIGIKPNTLIGHSLGEYAMIMFNGILSLEEGLELVYKRNELIKSIVTGKMIAVIGDIDEIKKILPSTAQIAVRNTKERFTISCLENDCDEITDIFDKEEIPYRILAVSKPFHTEKLRVIEKDFLKELSKVSFGEGIYDMVSTYYGELVDNEKMTSSEYWINHMCGTVKFWEGFEAIERKEEDTNLFIEVGANSNLSNLAYIILMGNKNASSIASLSSIRAKREEGISFIELLGELWLKGEKINFEALYSDYFKKKVSLPSYSFDKHYFNSLDDYYPQKSTIDIDEEKWNAFILRDKELDKISPIKLIKEYDELNEEFDNLCLYEAINYFVDNKIEVECEYDKAELLHKLNVGPDYIHFFEFLLKILKKNGKVTSKDNKLIFHRTINMYSKDDVIGTAKSKFPEFSAYIDLLHKCATRYNDVFSGIMEGNSIIYPEGSFDMLSQVYENTPNTTMKDLYSDEAVEIINNIVDSSDSKIKILEIGSGTGRLTWPLMEQLKNKNVEYWFTDIGRSFVREGEKYAKDNGITNMKFAVYDIEKNICDIPLQEGEFDIVVGLDVIQATTNIVSNLSNLFRLLKPLGWMMMIQSFWLHDIDQMIYGYAPGWWNYYNDPVRNGKCVVFDEQGWKNAFKDAQLHKVHTISGGWNGVRRESGIVLGMKAGTILPRNSVSGRYVFSQDREEIKEAENITVLANTNNSCCNSTVARVISIIYDTIGKEGIVPQDNLNDIGIDSLAILIIRSKIKKEFSCNLMVKDFYECKNIESLANKINSLTKDGKEIKTNGNNNKKYLNDLLDMVKNGDA